MTYKRKAKRTVKKVIKTAKKLNRKPKTVLKSGSKRIAKKAIKKVIKLPRVKRLPSAKTTAKKLTKKAIKVLLKRTEKTNIEKATVKQLKEYIIDNAKLINASKDTMNRASKKALKEAIKLFGEGEETGTLGINFKGDKKIDLVEKARVLESIISGDGVSTIAIIRRNLQTLKAFKSFKKGATGINLEGLDFKTYNKMVTIAGRVQNIISPNRYYQLFENLYEYKDTLGMDRVGDIMIEEYNNSKGLGLDENQLTKKILKRLKNELKSKEYGSL